MDQVAEILGKPFDAGFDETTLKIRRNLLIASSISAIAGLSDVRLDLTKPILGFSFKNLSDDVVRWSLVAVTSYLLLHFTWCVVEAFAYWRIRVTGTRLAFKTTGSFAAPEADYPDDPKQSSLYNWWLENSRSTLRSVTRSTEEFRKSVEKLHADPESGIKRLPSLETQRTRDVVSRLESISRSIQDLNKTLRNGRIEESLRRFDGWYRFFLKSQNLRWILIDVIAPIAIAIVGLVALTRAIIS